MFRAVCEYGDLKRDVAGYAVESPHWDFEAACANDEWIAARWAVRHGLVRRKTCRRADLKNLGCDVFRGTNYAAMRWFVNLVWAAKGIHRKPQLFEVIGSAGSTVNLRVLRWMRRHVGSLMVPLVQNLISDRHVSPATIKWALRMEMPDIETLGNEILPTINGEDRYEYLHRNQLIYVIFEWCAQNGIVDIDLTE